MLQLLPREARIKCKVESCPHRLSRFNYSCRHDEHGLKPKQCKAAPWTWRWAGLSPTLTVPRAHRIRMKYTIAPDLQSLEVGHGLKYSCVS